MYAFSAFQENRAVVKRQSNEALLRKYFGLGSFSKVHRDFFSQIGTYAYKIIGYQFLVCKHINVNIFCSAL